MGKGLITSTQKRPLLFAERYGRSGQFGYEFRYNCRFRALYVSFTANLVQGRGTSLRFPK